MFSFITFSFSFLSVNYLFSAPGSERRGRAPPPAGRCGGAAVRPRPAPPSPALGGRCAPRCGRARRAVRAAGPPGICAPPRWGRQPVLESPRRSSGCEGLVREGTDLGRVSAGRTACPEPGSVSGWWVGTVPAARGAWLQTRGGSRSGCGPSRPAGAWWPRSGKARGTACLGLFCTLPARLHRVSFVL